MKLQVIVGSTRPSQAARQEGFETEVLDLRDWPLPMFGEHMGRCL